MAKYVKTEEGYKSIEDLPIGKTSIFSNSRTWIPPEGNNIGIFSIEEGEKYTISFDGVDYECVSYTSPTLKSVCIGNASILNEKGGSSEPFLIKKQCSDGMVFVYTNVFGENYYYDHILNILDECTLLQKLNDIYIVTIICIKEDSSCVMNGDYTKIRDAVRGHQPIQFNIYRYDKHDDAVFDYPDEIQKIIYNDEDYEIIIRCKFDNGKKNYTIYIEHDNSTKMVITDAPQGDGGSVYPGDDHINDLINTALGVIENGTY